MSRRLRRPAPLTLLCLTLAIGSPAIEAAPAARALNSTPVTALNPPLRPAITAGQLEASQISSLASIDLRSLASLEASDPTEAPSIAPSGAPIEAPFETWTWIDFPGAVCMDGSPTGIGVNLTDRSDRVLIFLEGGGGCWDYETCYQLNMAANINGYTEQDFFGEALYNQVPLFDRTDLRNAFQEASYIYVPYCTGDVHSGDNVMELSGQGETQTAHFVGHRNMGAYLSRIVPTFPDVERVWLAGWSAGGFGAALNWDQVQRAFGGARVDCIDDSGPAIMPNSDRWETWIANWNIQFPLGCTDCESGLDATISYYADLFDGTHRYALLSYTHDIIISSYFGMSRAKFSVLIDELATDHFDQYETMKYFYRPGTSHVLLATPNRRTEGGVSVGEWIWQMVNDSPDWESGGP